MRKLLITKIQDNEINKYLETRNYIFNRSKMINQKKISRLNHYKWWFENKREIFVLNINSSKKIYFWQQQVLDSNKKYYIGGWTSNYRRPNLVYVLYALKWLDKKNLSNKKNYEWIAVVKKTNKSVLQLTKLIGYFEISKKDKITKIIKKIFNVSNKNFYFLKKN